MKPLLIYTDGFSNRLSYTLQLFFNQLLKLPFELIVLNDSLQINPSEPHLIYSTQQFENSYFQMPCSPLLFEDSIEPKAIEWVEENSTVGFFATDQIHTNFSFDVFSAAFYLCSRYEEYLPFEPDEHGRFSSKNSMLVKQGLHQRAIVNEYANLVQERLQAQFPALTFNRSLFQFVVGYDIDHIFKYKAKPYPIKLGGLAKDLLTFNVKSARNRLSTLLGTAMDPYYTFPYLLDFLKERKLSAHFFFLLANRAKYDKNINYDQPAVKQLISEIRIHGHQIGIHPSYESNSSTNLLKTELERLRMLVKYDAIISRQHYLKLRFPETYQRLLASGIKKDFTLGFHDESGFRAGICSPYFFFDLSVNKATELLLYPLSFMEATHKYHKQTSEKAILKEAENLITVCKKHHGCFSLLWHNDNLIHNMTPIDWKGLHEQIVELALSN